MQNKFGNPPPEVVPCASTSTVASLGIYRGASAIPVPNNLLVPIALSVRDAVKVSGLSRAFLYREMGANRIPYIKRGMRRLIRMDALDAYLQDRPVKQVQVHQQPGLKPETEIPAAKPPPRVGAVAKKRDVKVLR